MIAVDTNVLVRLLTYDDRRQAGQASALFASEDVWIARSVLLETSWVLKSVYRFGNAAVHQGLRMLVGLSNVTVEDRQSVVAALALIEQGLEFADALHFTSSPPGFASLLSMNRS